MASKELRYREFVRRIKAFSDTLGFALLPIGKIPEAALWLHDPLVSIVTKSPTCARRAASGNTAPSSGRSGKRAAFASRIVSPKTFRKFKGGVQPFDLKFLPGRAARSPKDFQTDCSHRGEIS
jgi:hypothetical protein